MKYWEFDAARLIADYNKNQKTLASVEEALIVARGFLKDNITDTARGETEKYIELLELREHEYQLYTDMVLLGMNELPEIERNILNWWLIERKDTETILYNTGIKNEVELNRIKEISLAKFKRIVMP